LPALATSVAKARAIAHNFVATHCNANAQLTSDIALCVSEAAGNAVAHAYPTPSGDITLTFTQAPSELIVEVCDEGIGAAAHSPNPGLGLGIKIVQTLSDATFQPLDKADNGLRVTMRFPCCPQPVTTPPALLSGRSAATRSSP
jgi:anti-sigma regulatory factor (Ser/Thr protein kinase)